MDRIEIVTSKLRMRPSDLGLILEVPFELSTGFESLSIEVVGDLPERTTLDLGLADPSRIRGWSGGVRRSIELSHYCATPGYLYGELPSGRWIVLLSPYEIGNSFEIDVRVEGKLYQPRWLKGDLHVHSIHSDGLWSLPDLIRVANEIGLDLLALTDHNTISQNVEAEKLGYFKDEVQLLPAMEWTTRRGHANLFGLCDPLPDWRVADDREFASKVKEATSRGALMSVNHPFDDFALGLSWDWTYVGVGCVEIWNGPWRQSCESARILWEKSLCEGRKLVALGGSDVHGPSDWVKLGSPVTWIYTTSPGISGVISALKNGAVYLTRDMDEVTLGDASTVPGSTSADGWVTVVLKGLSIGYRIDVICDGKCIESHLSKGLSFEARIKMPAEAKYLRTEVYRYDKTFDVWLPLLITNPIWYQSLDVNYE